ncbi:MAG: hypothetical protein R2759_15875 [Bacteroidales bacterium]
MFKIVSEGAIAAGIRRWRR